MLCIQEYKVKLDFILVHVYFSSSFSSSSDFSEKYKKQKVSDSIQAK